MVIQNLKSVLLKNKDIKNVTYLRNLLKEELQVFVLNFIYTSEYKNLIFTGGTCLRKFYDLPRLSEDLDFDIPTKAFDFDKFQNDLKKYFVEDLSFKNFDLKFKNKTVMIKFPILREIGYSGESDTNILFLRIDFAFRVKKEFGLEKKLYSEGDFSFLANCYDFKSLMANKIDAFLNRTYKKGSSQTESFKGRDAFDLVWMLDKAKKQIGDLSFLTPSLKKQIIEKSEKIRPDDLYYDLNGFFADSKFTRQFCDNFQDLVKSAIIRI